jgi:hemoglobin-like flavoprotein
MALDVELLRGSFNLVAEREPELTKRFYEIFFTRYPQVRPMFHRTPPEQQQKMLRDALVAVLDHLEDAPWLTQNLKALGAKHVEYGVTDEMYNWVGESLLAAIANAAGDAWSPALAAAWTEAYGAIAGLAKAGAAEARAPS